MHNQPSEEEDSLVGVSEGVWSQWVDHDLDNDSLSRHKQQHRASMLNVENLPPQLHPAVSLGIKRVSSCYLDALHRSSSNKSINGKDCGESFATACNDSMADLLSLCLAAEEDDERSPSPDGAKGSLSALVSTTNLQAMNESPRSDKQREQEGGAVEDTSRNASKSVEDAQSADLLYHDVLMNVFTFMDAKSLAAFSETSRRSNFECFYFLQLQIQRAVLVGKTTIAGSTTNNRLNNADRISSIAGSGWLSRLAELNRDEADAVVQEFLESNSTLKHMPLSHSLAYIRQLIQRNGFHHFHHNHHYANANAVDTAKPSQALASAAFVFVLMGAASVMSGGSSAQDMAAAASHFMNTDSSFGTEIPYMMFKLGFVGSLMKAARNNYLNSNDENDHGNSMQKQQEQGESPSTMRQRAEQMARMMQEMPIQMMRQVSESLAAARHSNCTIEEDGETDTRTSNGDSGTCAQHLQLGHDREQPQPEQQLSTPNPYEHLPEDLICSRVDDGEGDTKNISSESAKASANTRRGKREASPAHPPPKMPSGCVGAYSRAVARANRSVQKVMKELRKSRFLALSEAEQLDVSTSLIDACQDDDSLQIVKDLVLIKGTVDVDGFYVGSDGTETCALHAAAFHGANQVLEFLCRGMDESNPREDGGLCDVNLKDVNGWTAMHFAAGINSVDGVRILQANGASQSVEADNGYTPLQWAVRLANEEVAEELRRCHDTNPENYSWMLPARPLSAIANRFFAMIPSH